MKFVRLTAIVGICMIGVSILPWLLALRNSVAAVLSYGYFVGLFQQDSAAGLDGAPNVLGTFLIPGALFLLASSRGKRFGTVSAVAIIAAYSAGHLFLGSRSPAVAAIAACLWLYDRCVRPVRRVVVVSLVAVVILLLPFVAATRNLSGAERSADALLDTLTRGDNPLAATIREMGGSMGVVAHTINLVPSVRPLDMGRSYAFALLTVFPNLFWDVHPTVSHGLLANWLVWTVDPSQAAVGGGLGFSFIAEAYLNFGWWGAPLALAVIGFLAGTLGRWTRDTRDAAKLAMIATILSFAFIFARGESASVVRGVVWYSIFPCVAVHLLSRGGRGSLVR
jgi:hypothetical protein